MAEGERRSKFRRAMPIRYTRDEVIHNQIKIIKSLNVLIEENRGASENEWQDIVWAWGRAEIGKAKDVAYHVKPNNGNGEVIHWTADQALHTLLMMDEPPAGFTWSHLWMELRKCAFKFFGPAKEKATIISQEILSYPSARPTKV